MPPFIPIQKRRKPGPGEIIDPACQGTGRIDNHVHMKCHGSGVIKDPAAKGSANSGNGGNAS